jgi:hypothetical protein
VLLLLQVAGLDMGWHTLLDLQENPDTKRLEITRDVLPGTYNFKFIVDGRWVANHDYPTYLVGFTHMCTKAMGHERRHLTCLAQFLF